MELDNDKKKNALVEDEINEPYGIEEDEVDTEYDDDLPIDDFDILDDEHEEDEEEDDEPVIEEEQEEEPDHDDPDYEQDEIDDKEESSKAKKNGKLSKAEIKLIALKRQNKELLQEKVKLEQKFQENAITKERESIKQKLLDQNYDPDVAEKMAADEIRMRSLEEKQAILDFRDSNESLFAKYPQARSEATSIMRNSNATGMTPEQICRGLYGSPKPANDLEQRAIDAVRGKIKPKQSRTPNTEQSSKAELTSRELQYKSILEKNFLDGEKMSIEEFKEFQSRRKSTQSKVNGRRTY